MNTLLYCLLSIWPWRRHASWICLNLQVLLAQTYLSFSLPFSRGPEVEGAVSFKPYYLILNLFIFYFLHTSKAFTPAKWFLWHSASEKALLPTFSALAVISLESKKNPNERQTTEAPAACLWRPGKWTDLQAIMGLSPKSTGCILKSLGLLTACLWWGWQLN